MLNSSEVLRGYMDTIILAQLKEGDSYGYSVGKNIHDLTDGMIEMKEATLYTTFRKLESSGMIESYWGDGNSGARRRYYHLTEEGKQLLEENQKDWKRYSKMICSMLGV